MHTRRCALALVAVTALTFTLAGCTEEVEKEFDKLERSTTNNKALNKKVASVPLGSSVESVRAKLGKPDSYQVMNNEFGKTEYLYYGQWQLSFEDGQLDSKNKY
jgi:outer membrane protein assembly factor BamE (lipoprotein component of BamABCDE complex)